MVGLLDVAPVSKHVDIDGQSVDVPGVSAEGIAYLLSQFPQFIELQALMSEGGDKQDLTSMLFKLGPKILHEILAAGCGYPGNTKAIDRVAAYDLSTQADLLDAILAKTLPKGLDHFLGRLQSIQATLSRPVTLADKIQESLQKKQPLSNQSNSLSDAQAIQPAMSGA